MVKFLSDSTAIIAAVTLIFTAEVFALEKINKVCHTSFLEAVSCELFNTNATENNVFFIANEEGQNEDNIEQNSPESLLDKRLELIEQLDELQVKIEMLINLDLDYYQIDKKIVALNTLNSALEISQNVENKPSQVWLMLKIATAYLELQEVETGSKILDDALTIVKKIKAKPEAAALLIDLGAKYEQIGNVAQSTMILTEVATLMAQIENPPPSFPFKPLPLTVQFRAGSNFFSAQDTLLDYQPALPQDWNMNFKLKTITGTLSNF